MKKVLVWNKNINKYSIRILSTKEEEKYNKILSLKEKAKALYYMVVRDAEEENIPLDLYIDNEAYSTYCVQNNYVSEIEKTAKEFGVEFSIPRLLLD